MSGIIPAGIIEKRIFFILGEKVMLDYDLAELYQVPTRVLNQAVRQNIERFPERYMFQLTAEEFEFLGSQFVISNVEDGRGGRRYLPFAFTEHYVLLCPYLVEAAQVNCRWT